MMCRTIAARSLTGTSCDDRAPMQQRQENVRALHVAYVLWCAAQCRREAEVRNMDDRKMPPMFRPLPYISSIIFLSIPLRALRLRAISCRVCARIVHQFAKCASKRLKSSHACGFAAEFQGSATSCRSLKLPQTSLIWRQNSRKSLRIETVGTGSVKERRNFFARLGFIDYARFDWKGSELASEEPRIGGAGTETNPYRARISSPMSAIMTRPTLAGVQTLV
jgi:hypothetical protein